MPVPAVKTQYTKSCSITRHDAPVRSGVRFLAFAGAMAVAVLLAGCQSGGLGDITGSIDSTREPTWPTSEPELRRFADDWGHNYDRDPNNKRVAMIYARALHALDEQAQAAAVLQRLAAKYPKDMDVLAAYGKALADVGRLREAADVLSRAHTPERPNWSVLSAQGSVADQLGDHAQAQEYYAAALKIVPHQPQVLSNLGLSYALSKQLPRAETTLQEAVAQPGADRRVRQNLALVLALEGKFKAAQDISERDLAPIDAAGNVATIRQMIAQSNTWNDIRKLDKTQQARTESSEKRKTQAAEIKSTTPTVDPHLSADVERD
jgi:Flp pilus assembly protein TadD